MIAVANLDTARPCYAVMKSRRFSLFLFVFAAFSGIAIAQEGPFWTGPPPSGAVRVAEAQEWRKRFGQLDQQVPTLSPKEAEWLRREYDDQLASNDGNLTSRAIDAMRSREFHVRRARAHLDLLLEVLTRLAQAGYKSERQEVTDWARLASLMADFPFWLSVEELVKGNVVMPEINGVIPSFYYTAHASWASKITARIVVPFLEREN